MTKTIRILVAVLAAQLLLALGMRYTGPDLAASTDDSPLLDFGSTEIDRIEVRGPDESSVTLARIDGTWQLPEHMGFPADGERVDRLLADLGGLRRGLPVATTREARARFEVEEEAFERRITLSGGGDAPTTFYLGTSPSVREVHARLEGADEIYAVEFATYDVPATAEAWEDKTILQMPESEIDAIEVAGLTVARNPDANGTDEAVSDGDSSAGGQPPGDVSAGPAAPTWRAEGLGPEESIDADAADELAHLLANVRIGRVLGREQQPTWGLESPILELALIRGDGERIEYRLGEMTDAEQYVLHVSTRPEHFRLPGYTANPIIDAAKRETLAPSRSASAEAGDGENPDTAASEQ